MIDLINDNDVRDPWPLPFDWSDDLFDYDLSPGFDERYWYPQIDGSGLAPFNVYENVDEE